jgi:hypothetical protein
MNNHREVAPRSVLSDDEHERLRGLIPEYAMARLRNSSTSTPPNAFESHLASCADCQSELNELCQLLEDTAAATLPPSADYPELDASYLPVSLPERDSSAPSDTPFLTNLTTSLERAAQVLKELVIQFTEEIVSAFHKSDLAGSFRGMLHGSYQHPKQDPDDLHIAIDISTPDPAGTRCRVVVTVVDPQNPFAQEGHSVILRYGTEETRQISDHRGCVAFEDIPSEAIPQLQFTIVPRTSSDGDA